MALATATDRRKSSGAQRTRPCQVIGYVRVSTDEQTLGNAAQRIALRKWCLAHGARLVHTFSDNGISGATSLDKRPGLLRALAAVEQCRARGLLVAKRDRLARDTLVATMVDRCAERAGAVVYSADGSATGWGRKPYSCGESSMPVAEYERPGRQTGSPPAHQPRAALRLAARRRLPTSPLPIPPPFPENIADCGIADSKSKIRNARKGRGRQGRLVRN